MTIDQTAYMEDHQATARSFPVAHAIARHIGMAPWRSMSDQSPANRIKPRSRVSDPNVSQAMAAHIASISTQRDSAAFECIFKHFGPRVKAYMLKLGADNALAEELMQETLVAVWRKADKFDPAKAAPSTWIFTIARNLRIDAYRKASRPEPDPNDPAFVPEADPLADEALAQSEMAVRLRSIIETLPEEQKTMLQLSYFQDKSHSEISDSIGIPLGTVKSRLRLAMQKVRHALGDDAQ